MLTSCGKMRNCLGAFDVSDSPPLPPFFRKI
jgi:hypothetical protein